MVRLVVAADHIPVFQRAGGQDTPVQCVPLRPLRLFVAVLAFGADDLGGAVKVDGAAVKQAGLLSAQDAAGLFLCHDGLLSVVQTGIYTMVTNCLTFSHYTRDGLHVEQET